MKRELAVSLAVCLLAAVPCPAEEAGGDGAFTIEMPIAAQDSDRTAYGLLPFGVHAGDHGRDGHPGWDIEFRQGAQVLVAADGVVELIQQDPQGGGIIVQIGHRRGERAYRTVYTNIGDLFAAMAVGHHVAAGDAIGVPRVALRTVGTTPVSFAAIHFQVDDLGRDTGASADAHAASPEAFLSPKGRGVFEKIWKSAAYPNELVEPLPTNPRDAEFPLTRRWNLRGGGAPAAVEFTCREPGENGLGYALIGPDGGVMERGRAETDTLAVPFPALTLVPEGGGALRRGLYDVAGKEMRLALAEAGAPAPGSLSRASLYDLQ